ncbi:hypothetical protein SLEP1_g21147 [Rubroshorea leprosula]|uniref:RING-type E3 ubiquitin transferase n=1 Tax=Rubroshorea leprosula TaxID=152421 RepID=A0AAV5J880_9ROSI|nr:hypothetical protein SLEP1_g21147 [Rubroshorea leprosula]
MFLLFVLTVALAVVATTCWPHLLNKWCQSLRRSCTEEVECVVCLSKVSRSEKLRSLPTCRHTYHHSCIENWLKVRPTCPLCRIHVPPRRNFLLTLLLYLVQRIGKWLQKYPLTSEIQSAVWESLGYIS